MAIDTAKLDAALALVLAAAPGITDADAANADGIAPVRVPRTSWVNATVVGDEWGDVPAAAVSWELKEIVAAGKAPDADAAAVEAAKIADYVYGLLYGPGFDPTNRKSQSRIQMFVASGLITPDMATAVLGDWYYPVGDRATAGDVTAARARLADAAARQARRQWLDDKAQQAKALVDGPGGNAVDQPTLQGVFVGGFPS